MEAKDLMIGDWVWYDNKQVQILQLSKDGKYRNITPIPLTQEILEKNGFTLKEGEQGMYGVTIAPYYTRDDVPFEVFCDGEPFAIWFKDPVNIKYVHEIQHALRLCGITREMIL